MVSLPTARFNFSAIWMSLIALCSLRISRDNTSHGVQLVTRFAISGYVWRKLARESRHVADAATPDPFGALLHTTKINIQRAAADARRNDIFTNDAGG